MASTGVRKPLAVALSVGAVILVFVVAHVRGVDPGTLVVLILVGVALTVWYRFRTKDGPVRL